MVAPADKDYPAELKIGFEHLFGENYKSCDLWQDWDDLNGLYSSNSNYALSVQINIDTFEGLEKDNRSRFSIENLAIGNYRPTSVSHSQDNMRGYTTIVRIEYVTNSLDDFLKALKDKTWGEFDKTFTERLEDTLREDD